MLQAYDVACFFLNKDEKKEIFTKHLEERNGRKFWDGNAKLNKFLHLAQNIYIAKTGNLLFSDGLYAYDNGAVVPEIQENYSNLLRNCYKYNDAKIPQVEKVFLTKFFNAFKNADMDELIELSHEDDAWKEKASYYKKADQKMNVLAKADEYKEQYADIVAVLDRMAC